jgi:hypothetical protein
VASREAHEAERTNPGGVKDDARTAGHRARGPAPSDAPHARTARVEGREQGVHVAEDRPRDQLARRLAEQDPVAEVPRREEQARARRDGPEGRQQVRQPRPEPRPGLDPRAPRDVGDEVLRRGADPRERGLVGAAREPDLLGGRPDDDPPPALGDEVLRPLLHDGPEEAVGRLDPQHLALHGDHGQREARRRGDLLRPGAGGDHHRVGRDGAALGLDAEDPAAALHATQGPDAGADLDAAVAARGVEGREEQAVVEAGLGDVQRRLDAGGEARLDAPGAGPVEQGRREADGPVERAARRERLGVGCILGDEERSLPRHDERHARLPAETVGDALPAVEREAREAIAGPVRRVLGAEAEDAAGRPGGLAGGGAGVDDERARAARGQRAGDGQADDAGAEDDDPRSHARVVRPHAGPAAFRAGPRVRGTGTVLILA